MTGFVGLKRCKRDHRQDGLAGVTGFRCVADVLPIAQMSTAGNVATKTRRREGPLRIRIIEGGRLGLPAPFLTPSLPLPAPSGAPAPVQVRNTFGHRISFPKVYRSCLDPSVKLGATNLQGRVEKAAANNVISISPQRCVHPYNSQILHQRSPHPTSPHPLFLPILKISPNPGSALLNCKASTVYYPLWPTFTA